MRPATITRLTGRSGLLVTSKNGGARRCLTMLHPPKFENEKLVSLQLKKLNQPIILTTGPVELCQGFTRKSRVDENNSKIKE